MTKKKLREVLGQEWVHSREEDTDSEMVFRPASYDFPPARGRKSFTLRPDGSLIEGGIGPTDARTETGGTWNLQDDQLTFYTKSAPEPSRLMKIVAVDKDRLVVKK